MKRKRRALATRLLQGHERLYVMLNADFKPQDNQYF
jgi:hypothetical protein